MKRETLEKIRRIAADTRGDPAMRAIAERIVRENEPKPDEIVGFHLGGGFKDPRHPGVRPSPEYIRHKFFDLEHWKKGRGGRFYTLFHEGVLYEVVLQKTPRKTYQWTRRIVGSDPTYSGDEFATITEAQEAAWNAIETMHSTPPSTKS